MSPPETDYLFITALGEELEALKRYFKPHIAVASENCPLIYHHVTVSREDGTKVNVTLTCLLDMGNVAAGILTTHAISDLAPQFVIMTGIAAGIKSKVALTEILIATQIFYYSLNKEKEGKTEVRPHHYPVDPILLGRIKNFASGIEDVHAGPFAVGESVIADTSKLEGLIQIQPKLIGVEMESYGVASAAASHKHKPGFIAVRGVSDFADSDKDDRYRSKALKNVAEFVNSFVREGNLPKKQRGPAEAASASIKIAIHHMSLYRQSFDSVTRYFEEEFSRIPYEIIPIEIDQTELFSNGIMAHPEKAFRKQLAYLDNLDTYIRRHDEVELFYFGMAHIPFMFHAGYKVNRRIVELVASDRVSGGWLKLQKGAGFEPLIPRYNLGQTHNEVIDKVIVTVSISYPVLDSQIEGVIDPSLPSCHLQLAKPTVDIVLYQEQVEKYAAQFQNLLMHIKNQRPYTKEIHLFLSVPPSIAFRFGQQVSQTIDPKIYVYNYAFHDNPEYGWKLDVTGEKVIDLRST